jgi:hypothetical protein
VKGGIEGLTSHARQVTSKDVARWFSSTLSSLPVISEYENSAEC